MAVIDGRVPEPDAPNRVPPRVVVKLADPADARHRQKLDAASGLARAVSRLHGGKLESYLGADETLSDGRRTALAGFRTIEVEDAAAADRLAAALTARDDVDIAYVESEPTPPPAVDPSDDPRSGNQGYLNAAPVGIDARWAWNTADGAGIGFVDVEQGWTLDHEDLAAAGITIISGVNTAFPGHGTAVLGEVVAGDNARGGIGIAPRAKARVVSQFRSASVYSTAAAILSAVDAMSAGDVMLLEAQTVVGTSTYLPVEVEPAVFAAIRAATDAGIVVIEAGGNGGNDLDTWSDALGRRRLDRSSPDFLDSGAILVGAASSTAPHTRLGFSNFGSRVDCFAWGENIDTTGDGWMGTSTTAYTSSFGGTSGASPIVAGAAVLLQSWRRRREGRVFDPETVRALLSGAGNTISANPASDRIGVMPDLRAVITRLIDDERFRPRVDQYIEAVYVLFGLLNDAPGMIWVPGKGPVPVDPGWGDRAARSLELLGTLLARELIARGVADVEVSTIAEAATSAFRSTLEIEAGEVVFS